MLLIINFCIGKAYAYHDNPVCISKPKMPMKSIHILCTICSFFVPYTISYRFIPDISRKKSSSSNTIRSTSSLSSSSSSSDVDEILARWAYTITVSAAQVIQTIPEETPSESPACCKIYAITSRKSNLAWHSASAVVPERNWFIETASSSILIVILVA